MKKNKYLFLLIFSLLNLLLFSEDLRTLTIEDDEWDQEWQRVIILQNLDLQSLSQLEIQQIQNSVKEGMFIRKIMLMLAEHKNLFPSDQEVEQRYEELKIQIDDPQLWESILKDQLHDENSYRNYLRDSLAIDRLLEEEVRNKLMVTHTEALDFYEENSSGFMNLEGQQLNFEDVKEIIVEKLMNIKIQEAEAAYMDRLKALLH